MATTDFQALAGLDPDALVARLVAGLPAPAENEARLRRALGEGPWHFTPVNGTRLEVSRNGGGRYLVAGLPSHLVRDASSSFACSCTDSQRHARQGIRCKHVWARILCALGRVPVEPAGLTDRATLWGESLPGQARRGRTSPGQARRTLPDPATSPARTTNAEVAMSNSTHGGWQGRQFRHNEEALGFPFVQFVNSGGDLEPRQKQGGFAAPVDQGVPIPGVPATLHHKGGGSTAVIYAPELTLTVVKTRFAWVKDGKRLTAYQEGARGKLQALGVIQTTAGPQIAMLTFTGLAGRNFSAVRKAHADSVRKATSGKAPAWAFWLTVKADGTELVGKGAQSPVTKLALVREVDANTDYVGDDVADQIEALLDGAAVPWAAAWGGVSDEENGHEEAEPEPPASTRQPATPGTQKQAPARRVTQKPAPGTQKQTSPAQQPAPTSKPATPARPATPVRPVAPASQTATPRPADLAGQPKPVAPVRQPAPAAAKPVIPASKPAAARPPVRPAASARVAAKPAR